MKIEFTNHAREKFIILGQHNFVIEETDVAQAILQPSEVKASRKNRFVAERAIDETHLLRVVYEASEDRIVVITFYPAKRSRYEDKL